MHAVEPDTRVNFVQLTTMMRSELSKMRHLFAISFYVICTALLILLLCVHRVAFITADAPLYYQLQAERIFEADSFRELQHPGEFYPWLRSAMLHAANSTKRDHSRVLNLVALRQIRMYRDSCVASMGRHIKAVDPLTQAMMASADCVQDPQVSTDGVTDGFGVGDAFRLAKFSELQGFNHVADFHTFENSDIEYLTTINVEDFEKPNDFNTYFLNTGNATEALSNARNSSGHAPTLAPSGDRILDPIDDLDTNRFIDDLTSAVAVDTIVMFPQRNILVLTAFIMEQTTTGMFTVEVHSDAFRFFVSHRGIIFLDVLIFVCFLALVALLVIDLHEEFLVQVHDGNPTVKDRIYRYLRCIGIWDVLTFALVVSILTVTGMRLRLWDVSGRKIDDVGHTQAFNLCVDSYTSYKRIYELYCVSLVLAAFRLFYSFRYLAGLHKIANTLSASARDLGRVFILWIILLVVFTITGCMIFGRDVFGMRTFWQALVFLMTVLVSAQLDEDDYRMMFDTQGTVADIYLIALFVIFWLMLLNLVIAIISSSFLTTNENIGNTETTSILTVAQIYVTFTHPPYYAVDRISHRRNEAIDGMSPSQRVASRGLQILLPLHRRVMVLYRLRRWRLKTYKQLVRSAVKDDADSSTRLLKHRTISYEEALDMTRVYETLLDDSQLSSGPIIAQLFLRVQRQRGAVLHSVNESVDAFARVCEMLGTINGHFDVLATELRRHRNIGRIGIGADETPKKRSGPRPRGKSLKQIEEEGVSLADAASARTTFSVADVAELDSHSDIDDDDGAADAAPIDLDDLRPSGPSMSRRPKPASAAAASDAGTLPRGSSSDAGSDGVIDAKPMAILPMESFRQRGVTISATNSGPSSRRPSIPGGPSPAALASCPASPQTRSPASRSPAPQQSPPSSSPTARKGRSMRRGVSFKITSTMSPADVASSRTESDDQPDVSSPFAVNSDFRGFSMTANDVVVTPTEQDKADDVFPPEPVSSSASSAAAKKGGPTCEETDRMLAELLLDLDNVTAPPDALDRPVPTVIELVDETPHVPHPAIEGPPPPDSDEDELVKLIADL